MSSSKSSSVVYVKLLSPDAFAPKHSTPGAAGLDLLSPIACRVKAKDKLLIDLNLLIDLPDGTYGRIAPRSGLSANHFIDVGAGVIDPDYIGSIKVLLYNFSKSDFVITRGMAIAQLICEKFVMPAVEELTTELPQTTRGDGGFGSTDTLLGEDTTGCRKLRSR